MIFRRETSAFAEAGEYIFKHAMLREVTYESVLRQVRRVYHGLVAEWLMAQSAQRQSEVTGLIADHLESAGRMAEARVYLRQAGEQAAAQYANAEAVRCFSRALELTPAEDIAGRYELLLTRESLYDLQGVREAQAEDLVALEALAEALNDGQKRAEVALRRLSGMGNGAQTTRAAKISDEKMRRSFLENVAPHREIMSEFAERTWRDGAWLPGGASLGPGSSTPEGWSETTVS